MKKKTWMSLLLLLLLAAAPLSAQTDGAKHIKAHCKAMGGVKAWQAIKSLKLSGNYTGFSITHPFTLVRQRPDHLWMSYQLGEHPIEMGFDGSLAWWVNPWYQMDWPVPMGKVDSDWQRFYRDFATPFFDYRERQLTMNFLGEKPLEGQVTLAFEFRDQQDFVETWHLDPSSHLPIARISTGSEFGRPVVERTWFDDFRKVQGLTLPFRIESEFHTRHRVMEIDKVELNGPVDQTRFSRPLPSAFAPLASLAGDWQVTVRQRPTPRHPWQEQQTRSQITAEMNGLVLRETISYGTSTPADITRQFSYDRFRNRLTLIQTDSYTTNTAIMVGDREGDHWVWDNRETGSSWKHAETEILDQIKLLEKGPKGFKLEVSSSRDGGTTWETHTELVYGKAEVPAKADHQP